ncbi:MAG: class I SAM-dependent methyltransferase [Planctomycetota bacterium]
MTGNDSKWDKINQRYTHRRESGRPGWTDDYTHTEQEIRDFLARNRLSPAGTFLELGCGAGNRILVAARMGFEAFGVDQARDGIAWASAKAEEAGVRVDFRVGDIVTLKDYHSNFFDVVYDGGVLYMITGYAARKNCFQNIARVLKSGGRLYATAHLVDAAFTGRHEMAPGSWYDPSGRFSTVGDEPAYYFSTEEELRGEIEGADLVILTMEKILKKDPEHPFCAGSLWADARKPDVYVSPNRSRLS